jgi:hypothetical protein
VVFVGFIKYIFKKTEEVSLVRAYGSRARWIEALLGQRDIEREEITLLDWAEKNDFWAKRREDGNGATKFDFLNLDTRSWIQIKEI